MELLTTNVINSEPVMGIDAFNNTEVSVGLKALATRIINLILQEKGTISNCYNMGVGLAMETFELLTDQKIDQIHSEILRQVSTYLPELSLNNVTLEQGTGDVQDRKALYMKMEIRTKSISMTGLYFSFKQKKDGTVVAEAYI